MNANEQPQWIPWYLAPVVKTAKLPIGQTFTGKRAP